MQLKNNFLKMKIAHNNLKVIIFSIILFTLNSINIYAQPSNDNPCNAIALTPNATCTFATYTNAAATATAGVTAPGCASYSGGDVWFSTVIPASGQITINTNTGVMTDGGMAIYSGTCGSLTLIECDDDDSPNGLMPLINYTGTPGQTIFIRMWEFGNNNNGTFSICVQTITPPPALSNDNPCNAIALTPSTTCTYANYTNAGATATAGVTAPGCANYSGGDVWFSTVIPAGGQINIDTQTGVITDGGMAIYSGTCGALTLISCNDDSSPNGAMPLISYTGTPGQTIFIRVWEYGNDNNGTFGICVQAIVPTCSDGILNQNETGIDCGGVCPACPPATNQDCPGAIPVCQNVYSQATAYSGTGNIPNEINSLISCLGSGEKNDVWYTFTVQQSGNLCFSITPNILSDDYDWALYNLTTANCNQIGTNAALEVSCNFSGVSGITGANGAAGVQNNPCVAVTAGQTYVLNVSQFSVSTGGYTLNFGASSAVIFDNVPPAIQSVIQPIACGATTLSFNFTENILCSTVSNADFTLTGPGGPYTLSGVTGLSCSGAAGQENNFSATVSPPLTASGSYQLCLTSAAGSVTDLCGNVAPAGCLNFTITNGITATAAANQTICAGGTGVNLTGSASGGSGYTYSWTPTAGLSNPNIANPIATPATTTTYTLVATSSNGCAASATTTVTVNPAPTVSVTPSTTICQGNSVNLTASGMTTYSWTPTTGLTPTTGATVSASPAATQVYTVTGSTPGCPNSTASTTVTVTIRPIPNFTVGGNFCAGASSVNFTNTTTLATGATTYAWTFPSGTPASSTAASPSGVTWATPGTYNITLVATTAGCSNTVTIPITINPAPTVSITRTQPPCNGGNGTITATGSVAGTFSWSSGQTTAGVHTVPPGSYTVTFTSAAGCVATATTTVTAPPVLAITASGTNATCVGTCNGTLTANTATGGTAPYTYSWNGGLGAGQNKTSVCAGTYIVTVTDANNCTATATVTITASPLNTIAAGTNQTVCANSPLTAITLATTGATGATFTGLPSGVTGSWAGNVVTISGTPTAGGTFNYTVTTTGGCPPANTTGTITVTPQNTIAAGTSQTLCLNSPITTISLATTGATGATFTGLPAGLTGTWGGNVATISGTPTTAGTFNYTVTTTGGCPPATTTGTITVNPINTIAAGTSQTVCQNSPITTISLATVGATGATFTGLPAGVTGSWAGNVATISGTPSASGTFTYTITTTGGCPPATTTGTITVNPLNTIAPGTSQTLCINSPITSITLNTTGATGATFSGLPAGVTGSWAGNLATISGTPTAAGTFNYTVTTTGGCPPATATGTITVTPLNTIAAGTNQTVCLNSAITNISLATTGATGATFTGLPTGVTGAWAGNLATISGTPTVSGTFNYTVTTTGGCPPATTTGTITVNPINTIAAGTNQTVCLTSAIANITLATTGATGATFAGLPAGVTGSWAGNVVTISGTPSAAGTFNYTVTTTGGCPPATTTGTITVTPLNTIAAGTNQTICINTAISTITLATTGATGATFTGLPAGVTGSWAANVATISGTPTTAGTFNYTVTTTGGCPPATATGTITVSPLPTLPTPPTMAQSACALSTGSLTGAVAAGTGALTYSWTNSSNVQVGTGINLTNIPAGTYNLTVTDANGCPQTFGPFSVTNPGSPAAPVITGNPPSVCVGGTFTLTATSGAPTPTFQWTSPAGSSATVAGNTLTVSNAIAADNGSYSVTVTSLNCTSPASSVNIIVNPLNTISAGSSQTVCINSAIADIILPTTGATGATFTGLPAGVTGVWAGNVATISGTPTAAGTFNYMVTTTGGCPPATATGTITVSPQNTIAAGTNQTVCLNATITNITLATTGATGATFAGLPAGVTGSWAGNLVTISGTPTATGTFNYTVTTTGGCPPATTTGTITVNPIPTIVTGTNQTICMNSPITQIDLATTNATGATFTGLPAGVTGAWAGNIASISGTPTVSGTFNYTVSTTGPCGPATTTGTITVTPINTIATGTNQTICVNSALTTISLATTGATGATFTGLPAGVTGVWAGNIATISGTPTATGTFNYTVTTTGGCPPATTTGTITVNLQPTANFTSSGNFCQGATNVNFTNTSTGTSGTSTYAWTFPSGTPATSTSQNPSGVTWTNPGTYNITLTTTTDGCTNSVTLPITILPAATVTIAATQPLCNGGNGTINATGSVAGSFSWSSGQTTAGTHNVPAGSYTVIFTSTDGCIATATTTITNPALLTLTSSVTDAHCNQSDGQACALPTGGTTPYTYLWNDASFQTTQCANNIASGSYSVTVTDANGCTATVTQAVANIAGPTATASVVSDATGAGVCNGSATVNAVSGSAPYTYSWNTTPVQTTQNVSGLCAGNYCATVTDAFGCTSVSCITINEPNSLTITITPTNLLCNGICNGQAATTVSGGVAPYTFLWAHGPTAANLTGLCAGTYNLTVTDANGNTGTQSVTITQPPAIVIASLTNTPALCNAVCNGTITASANGGTGALVYSWTGGLANGTNPTGVCAGPYTLTVTDANNCTVTSNVNVAQPTPLVLNTNSINSNCGQPDGQACVVISGGTAPYSQVWDDASTQTTLCASAIPSGSYQVSVNDANGCTATATVTVSDNSAGTATAAVNNNVFCNGDCTGSATATMTGGQAPFTYSWTSGATPTAATTAGLCVGNASVTITDANGCSSTASVNITQPTTVSLVNSFTPVTCNGGSNGTVTTVASGGTSAVAYTYSWINQTTSVVVGTTPTVIGLPTGTYCVTVTDDNNCTANGCVTITEPAAITMTPASTNSNCAQANGTLSVSGIVGGSGTYVSTVWTDASATVVANPNAVLAGSYTVTVTDNNGCIGTATINVNDLTGPTASFVSAVNTLCNADCNGQGVANVTGGVAPYTLVWSPAPVSGQGTLSIGGLCADDYTLLATDAAGCASTITISITEPTVVGLNTGTITATSGAGICDGSANVVASGGTTPYSYAWFTDCTNTTPTGTTAASANGFCAGSYGMIVTDVNGCTADVCVTISSPNAITSTVTMIPTLCNTSADGSLTVTPNGGVPGYTYQWFVSPANTPLAGQTAATATNLASGNYYVVVTDANGITHTSAVTAVTSPTAIGGIATVTSNYNGFGVSCETTCNGSAIANPLGGTAPYSYDWGTNAGNQTTQSATNLCFGIYDVTVTDANGCTGVLQVTISKPPTFTSSITSVNDPCNATCAGSATVSTIGGIAPVTYQWDNPALSTTATATGLCAGTYNAIITDANGCILNQTAVITEPAAIVLSGTSQGSNCNQNDGSATVSIVTGAGPFTYLWDANAANQTTATASNLFAGCYDVVVTDGTGCTENIQVCVNDLGAPTANILTQTDVTCNGACDGFAQIQIIGGTAPYNYTWVDSNGNPTGVTTASNNTLCAGTYTGQMVDANGCQASVGVTINEPLVLNGLISASTDVTCFGDCDGSATATISGGTAPYTYQWNDGAAQTTATATNLCPGTYTVNVVDAQGCTFSLNTIIAEPAQIILNTTAIDAFCNTGTGSTTAVLVSGGIAPMNYSWNDPSTQNAITALNLVPGNYTVTATDADGCSNTATITVGDIPAGTATLTNITDVLCFGGSTGSVSVSMSGTGTAPYSYNWFNGSGLAIGQTGITASNLPTGNYYVEVTDANGCISTSVTTLINQPAELTATTNSSPTLCNGSCDGNTQVFPVGGVAPYTYLWDDPLSQNVALTNNMCAGTYTAIITDNNGCTVTATSTVTEPTALTATDAITDANCGLSNGQGCVIPSGGVAPYTYLWPNSTTNSCATGIPAGSYCVDVTDANGCVLTHCINIQDLNGPSATILNTVNVSCNAGNDGSATVDMIGGNGFFTAQWDNNAGNQVTPTASNLAAGTYGVTITDSIGCTASTSVTIIEPDALVSFQITNQPTCFQSCDATATINVVGGTQPYSYSWTNNLNAIIGTNATVSNLCQGNYNLTLNDANGCNQILNYVITDPIQVTGTVTQTNVTCFGACDGTITATGVNGIAPFTYQWEAAAANQTTATASGLCPGTYTCTITDANGCTNIVTGTIIEPTLLTADIPTSQNVSCFGLNDGFANALGAGGTAPYSYSWNNGAGTNATATNLVSGNYEVTITDANGCTSLSDVFIAQPTQLSATSSKTNVTCFGACNGTASVAVSGGTPNYTYQWDNAGFSTTSGISNLCNGTYNVIITDANNCQITTSVNITQPTDVNISATITNSNCGQNNGQICVNTFGGTFPYVYQWNDPFTQTTACASSLNAGCYLLTITDGNACFKDTLLCLNDIAGPTVTFVNSVDVNCNGNQNGLVEFNAVGGTGTLTLQWFNNLGVVIPAGNGSSLLTNLNGGCYTFQATDAAGCIASLTNCITEPNAINSAVFPSTNVTCFNGCNGTATVNANGGTAPYSFSWNNPGNTTAASATGLCAGTFTATVTDANSCSTQSSITITQPQQLQITIVSTVRPLCFGDCNGGATIGITGGTQPYLISWLTNGASGLTNGGLCAGQHTVVVTDANGCSAQIEVPLQDQQPLTVGNSIVGATCSACNGSVSLSPNGGVPNYSYNWNGVGTAVGQIANQGLCPGNGIVTVTDLNGCTFDVSYTVPDAGSPVIDNMTFTSPSCFGTSNGSASVFVSQGTPAYTYSWNDPFSQTVANAVALPAGNYCVSVTDQNGCATSNCINVTQPSVLGAVPDISRTICFGESTQLWASGQGGTSPYTINWTTAGLSGGGPITVSPTSTSNYCFTVTDANGCLSPNACITITVRDPLAIDLIDAVSLCTGLDVDLVATASGGDPTGYSFSWINAANNQSITDVEVGASSTITVGPTVPTTYQVTLSDGCSTDAIEEVDVIILNNPVAFLNVADSNGCEPFNAQFTINTDIGTNFLFDVNCDGTNEVTTTNTNFSYLFANEGLYDICLDVVSAAGCTTSLSYPELIEVYPLPVANFTPDPSSTTILTPYVTFNDNSIGGTTYNWDFGDGLTVNGLISSTILGVDHTSGPMITPIHTYADTGIYDVTLTVTTEYGCINTYTYPIVIDGDYAFYVSNAFTPDGDGVNDTFRPDGIGLDPDNYEFLIFNRWGQLIFESYNPNTSWDGTFNGVESQQDVYVWKIKTKDHTKKEREYYGHVTLVR